MHARAGHGSYQQLVQAIADELSSSCGSGGGEVDRGERWEKEFGRAWSGGDGRGAELLVGWESEASFLKEEWMATSQ
jgi:hypothetical protein